MNDELIAIRVVLETAMECEIDASDVPEEIVNGIASLHSQIVDHLNGGK